MSAFNEKTLPVLAKSHHTTAGGVDASILQADRAVIEPILRCAYVYTGFSRSKHDISEVDARVNYMDMIRVIGFRTYGTFDPTKRA